VKNEGLYVGKYLSNIAFVSVLVIGRSSLKEKMNFLVSLHALLVALLLIGQSALAAVCQVPPTLPCSGNTTTCSCPPPFTCRVFADGSSACQVFCNSYFFAQDQNLKCGSLFPRCSCPSGFHCSFDYHHGRPARLCKNNRLRG